MNKIYRAVTFKMLLALFLMVSFSAQSMIVFVNHAVFRSPDNNCMVELYLKIPINTVTLADNGNSGYQASIDIVLILSLKDSVVFYNRYNLLSPEFKDTMNLDLALTDLKRIELPEGNYNLQLEIKDNHQSENISSFSTLVRAVFPQHLLSFSEVQFADTVFASQRESVFNRNNYEIIPNVFNSYSALQSRMFFYTEFYEADQFVFADHLFVKYYLRKDTVDITQLSKTIKLPVQNTNYLLGNLNISELPDGEYTLVIEVFSPQNQKLRSKTAMFTKQKYSGIAMDKYLPSNEEMFAALIKTYTYDQMQLYISYVYLLSDADEIKKAQLLEKEMDVNELAVFFYDFWVKRDEKPLNAWLGFLQRVEDCNKMFTTMMRKGYLTDRGRIFLEYGPPNNVIESTSGMLTYPYQIWQYNKLTETQHNKKFVFFNRTGALDEYELIHSDARGEASNPKWIDVISKYNKLDPRDLPSFGDFLEKDFSQ